MFTIADRDRVRDHVLHLAEADPRVVAGAVVGSLARGEGDRWSDLDLTFGVTDEVPVQAVLEDWSRDLVASFAAIHLFDVPSGAFLYRVFLLPGCLQLDLSFAPAAGFGARGPSFRLLFGRATPEPPVPPRSTRETLGYAVHHALRARFSIERGRPWQAEYWISAVRDLALGLACRRCGVPDAYGRGFDDLAPEERQRFETALVSSLERDELRRSLRVAVEALLAEIGKLGECSDLAPRFERELRALLSDD